MDESKLNEILALFGERLEKSSTMADVESLKVDFLGKKGHVTSLFKELGKAAPADRPAFGEKINKVKEKV